MKAQGGNHEVRRLLLYRCLEVGLVLLIIGICVWGYGRTRQTQNAVEAEQARLADRPNYLLRLSTVQQELRGRSPDLERILRLIKSSQDIVTFIEELEAGAQGYKVVLEVPNINEVQRLDEAGEPIEERGPFRSISLIISAHGKAEDLLHYVHAMEHAPYLVSLRDWDITAHSTAAPVMSSVVGAREVGKTNTVVAPANVSQLNAELILVVHNENYTP